MEVNKSMLTSIGRVKNYIGHIKLQKKVDDKITKLFNPIKLNQSASSIYGHPRRIRINGKLKAGQTLTGADLGYLRDNDPELYKKAVQIMKERKELDNELRRCKSKDEAMRFKSSKLGVTLDNVSGGGKSLDSVGDNEFILMRVAAINDVYRVYKSGKTYKDLPEKSKLLSLSNARTDALVIKCGGRELDIDNQRKLELAGKKYAKSKLKKSRI